MRTVTDEKFRYSRLRVLVLHSDFSGENATKPQQLRLPYIGHNQFENIIKRVPGLTGLAWNLGSWYP